MVSAVSLVLRVVTGGGVGSLVEWGKQALARSRAVCGVAGWPREDACEGGAAL